MLETYKKASFLEKDFQEILTNYSYQSYISKMYNVKSNVLTFITRNYKKIPTLNWYKKNELSIYTKIEYISNYDNNFKSLPTLEQKTRFIEHVMPHLHEKINHYLIKNDIDKKWFMFILGGICKEYVYLSNYTRLHMNDIDKCFLKITKNLSNISK